MAGIGFHAVFDETDTAVNNNPRTLVQLALAANKPALLRRVRFKSKGGSGASATSKAIVCEVLIQTDAGAGSTAATLNKEPPDAAEALSTAALKGGQAGGAWTTEPTPGAVRWRGYLHPQVGTEVHTFDPPMKLAGGTRVGFRVINEEGTAYKVTGGAELAE